MGHHFPSNTVHIIFTFPFYEIFKHDILETDPISEMFYLKKKLQHRAQFPNIFNKNLA
jgi:hypothetical protein